MIFNIWPFNIRAKKLEEQKRKKKKIIWFSLIGITLILGGGVTTAILLLTKNGKSITINNSTQFQQFINTHTEYIHNEKMKENQDINEFFLDGNNGFKTNLVLLWNLSLGILGTDFYKRASDCKIKLKHSYTSIKAILLKDVKLGLVPIETGLFANRQPTYLKKSYFEFTLINKRYGTQVEKMYHFELHLDIKYDSQAQQSYTNFDVIGLHFDHYDSEGPYSNISFYLESQSFSFNLLKVQYPNVNIISQ